MRARDLIFNKAKLTGLIALTDNVCGWCPAGVRLDKTAVCFEFTLFLLVLVKREKRLDYELPFTCSVIGSPLKMVSGSSGAL